MKTLLLKFVPGLLAAAALLCLVRFASAQSHPAPTPAAAPRVVAAPPATLAETGDEGLRAHRPRSLETARLEEITVCGQCGAQLARPAAVLIAQPIGRMPGSFYGLPPMGYERSYYAAPCYYGSPGSQTAAFELNNAGLLPRWR